MNRFECVRDCSQCCVEREYYPSVRFGKIGVLVLPEEKSEIERLAEEAGVEISILPRIGISRTGANGPNRILAYQLMGRDDDGNTCPFLDDGGAKRSPHGGLLCRIYDQRPLACRAYPVIETRPMKLDQKCRFCQECKSADSGLDSEVEALLQIRESMEESAGVTRTQIWRYATGVGEEDQVMPSGWVPDPTI